MNAMYTSLRSPRTWLVLAVGLGVATSSVAYAGAAMRATEPAPGSEADLEQVQRGRQLVIVHGCGDCHGGGPNPAAEGWLAGRSGEDEPEVIDDFRVWPRNLTPDPETGTGRYTDRQLFNALRYGLRPASTPDVEITSSTPGVGNHPASPDYLAPGMPWSSFRHMSDDELRDIIAYLRTAVRPVRHQVPEPQAPSDRWASYAAAAGSYPLPAFPTARETPPPADRLEQALRGRKLVATMACGDCHGGLSNPASPRWLAGVQAAEQPGVRGPFEKSFAIGPFTTWPRNITPDNLTGIGRFSERQLFNALRYGLRPGETADVEVTSATPGQGNHPAQPKYLAPPMPWPAWRHMTDQELWDIAAYLKLAVRPVSNRVPDSEGPPDFWAGEYTVEKIGPYPAAPFPTERERMPAGGR